jgi:hypothetical protein
VWPSLLGRKLLPMGQYTVVEGCVKLSLDQGGLVGSSLQSHPSQTTKTCLWAPDPCTASS